MTLFPLFYKMNTMGIVLEEEEQIVLKFFTIAMIASKSSGKVSYATQWGFFMKVIEVAQTSSSRPSYPVGQ